MNDPIKKFKQIILENHMMTGGKASKLEAHYTDHAIGNEKCQYCRNFESPNGCDVVEGFISPEGWCKFFEERQHIDEKWGISTKVSPQEKGKFAGKTKAELLKSYNHLKSTGPHRKGSPEYQRMRELAFAIRAKSGWGKVGK